MVVALTYPIENPAITTIFKKEFLKLDVRYIREGRKLQTELNTQLYNQFSY